MPLSHHVSPTCTRSAIYLFRSATSLVSMLVILGGLSSTLFAQSSIPKNSSPEPTSARITFQLDGAEKEIVGEMVADDSDKGHLILDADGVLTAVPPDSLIKLELGGPPLVPASSEDSAKKALLLMPQGSKTIITEHFVVCYNTTDAYARWNAELYENLYRGFHRFWKSKGFELTPPRFPLVALIFGTKEDYLRFATREFQSAESTYGYYNQKTNRLASYDLTGVEGLIPSGSKVQRSLLVQEILNRPEAERTVATIVHEACHQIAFNCGLQVRLGASPLWLSEGLATYFETPDLNSRSGWGGVGKVNRHNLYLLTQYLPVRPEDSLTLLITEDSRLLNGATNQQGYAEAWGLTHFLLQTKGREMVKYLHELQKIPVGFEPNSKERLDLFRQCFGDDLVKINRDFMRHIQRVK